MKIRAISLWQPWASLIALGYKKYETRSWQTNYRGSLLICSAQKDTKFLRDLTYYLAKKYQLKSCCQSWKQYPLGQALAICNLVDCIPITSELIVKQSQLELDCGDWRIERYAWKLEHIRAINPFPIKGQQRLFTVDYDLKKIIIYV